MTCWNIVPFQKMIKWYSTLTHYRIYSVEDFIQIRHATACTIVPIMWFAMMDSIDAAVRMNGVWRGTWSTGW
jgi:hypothetical protein